MDDGWDKGTGNMDSTTGMVVLGVGGVSTASAVALGAHSSGHTRAANYLRTEGAAQLAQESTAAFEPKFFMANRPGVNGVITVTPPTEAWSKAGSTLDATQAAAALRKHSTAAGRLRASATVMGLVGVAALLVGANAFLSSTSAVE